MLACGLLPGVGLGPMGVAVGLKGVGVGLTGTGVFVGKRVGVGVFTGFPASAGETATAKTRHRPSNMMKTGIVRLIKGILLCIIASL